MTNRTSVLRALPAILSVLVATPSFAQWLVPPAPARAQEPFAEARLAMGRRGNPPLRLASQRPSRIPNQILVKYARSLSKAKTAALTRQVQAQFISEIPQLDIQVLRVPSVDEAMQTLRKSPDVLWVAPRLYRYPLDVTPNDPAYNNIDTYIATEPDMATWFKWDSHMMSCGHGWWVWPNRFYGSTVPKGNDAVTVAVIDTGIDYSHPDFINAGGTGTSVEQGGQLLRSLDASIFNGVVTPEAPDTYGHGTHVAGIVAASTNNGIGTVGTGYNANIMSVRVVDENGDGSDSDIAQGIVYAVDHGALIVNLSLGSYEYSQAEQDAVDYAWRKNVLVIAAAGNDGNDKLNYPSALSKVLSVAATSRISIATYSNYGPFVGMCAPGGDFDYDIMWLLGVYSTMPTYWVTLNDPMQYGAAMNYDYLMGTSMAAPHVAGAAAIRAGQKGYTRATPQANLKIWQALQRSADGMGGWNAYMGFGFVNIEGVVYEDIDPNWRGDTVGCITGQVRYRGTPVQNANILAKPVGGGSNFSATSRTDGGYRVANITQGTYTLTATLYGETAKIENVVVVAGCDNPGYDLNIGAFPSSLTVESTTGTADSSVPLRATFMRTDLNEPVEDIKVFFTLDSTELGSNLTNASGVAQYTTVLPPDIASGDHTIRADYYGEAAYKPASGTGTLTVAGGAETTMYAADRSGTITEPVSLRQYDLRTVSDGVLLQGKTITYKIDGTTVGTATTDAGGDSSLNWTIDAGPTLRTISVHYAGGAGTAACSAAGTLTCTAWGTKMVAFDRSGRITDRTELKARLLRSDNVPLYGKSIGFSVDGTFVISRVTDVDGYAKYGYYDIPNGSGAGVRPIVAEWVGSAGYLPVTKVASLTVQKALPYIWVLPKSVAQGGWVNLYAYFRRLYDYQKQEGKPVTFRIDGTWIANVTTGSGADAGVARYIYTTTEAPGVHTVLCEFAGDAWLEAGSGQANLTIY